MAQHSSGYDQALIDAFSLDHPAPTLLSLIRATPTYETITSIIGAYTVVVQTTPWRAKTLALALRTIRDAQDVLQIDGTDTSLADLLHEEIAEVHHGALQIDEPAPFGPTNPYLVASLLSGFSFKYDLTRVSDMDAAIQESLEANSDRDPLTAQIEVVGACIQLLTGGSKAFTPGTSYFQSPEEVAAKLKALKAQQTVCDANGQGILELAIKHAENGLKEENDIDNVWYILFPSPNVNE